MVYEDKEKVRALKETILRHSIQDRHLWNSIFAVCNGD